MMQEAGVNATASSYPKALPGSGVAEKWGLDLSFSGGTEKPSELGKGLDRLRVK